MSDLATRLGVDDESTRWDVATAVAAVIVGAPAMLIGLLLAMVKGVGVFRPEPLPPGVYSTAVVDVLVVFGGFLWVVAALISWERYRLAAIAWGLQVAGAEVDLGDMDLGYESRFEEFVETFIRWVNYIWIPTMTGIGAAVAVSVLNVWTLWTRAGMPLSEDQLHQLVGLTALLAVLLATALAVAVFIWLPRYIAPDVFARDEEWSIGEDSLWRRLITDQEGEPDG